jgi:hypothetical protein
MTGWKTYIDWNNDGDFVDALEDISAYVVHASWKRGRDYASTLTGQTTSLSGSITLTNFNGEWNSFNSSSPFYGLFKSGLKFQIVYDDGISPIIQASGFVDKLNININVSGQHTATISAYGPLGWLKKKSTAVTMHQDIRTGEAIDVLLDSAGWPAGMREIDNGYTLIPYWYSISSRSIVDLMRDLEASEYGTIYETKDGKIGFASRLRNKLPVYGVSAATLSDAPGATLQYSDIQQTEAEVYDCASATVLSHVVIDSAILWTCGQIGESSPSIAPGATLDIWASCPNSMSDTSIVAVQSWTTPVATTDFRANTTALGSGADITSDISVTVSKFSSDLKISLKNNNAATAYIIFLQARGSALQKSTSSVSSGTGDNQFPISAPWLPSVDVAQGYCDQVVADFKDLKPILSVQYPAFRSAAQKAESLARDLMHRITLTATGRSKLGVSADFIVDAISMEIMNNIEWSTTYEVQQAPAYVAAWVLGATAACHLGTDTKLVGSW